MDESLQELENELKTPPRRASARWLAQVNRELAAELPASARPRYATATNLNSWKWLGWRPAGLAAALALVAAIGFFNFRRAQPESTGPAVASVLPPAAPASVAAYQPVTVEGDTSARQVRARYVDTYTWKNPRNNASIKWTVPRDEIRVVPASYTQN